MLYVINPNQDLLKKWLCTGLLYKGITIQTSPFHHVVLRSNEERESAINVFLPPLLSVDRQRVRPRPSTVFSGRHVGWREGQPAVQACQKWESPPARENGEEGALHNECLL